MHYSQAVTGGVLYAAVMAGLGLVSGAGANLGGNAVGGALMWVSIMADAAIHRVLDVEGTVASSALVTGASFAALQRVTGRSDSLVRDAVAGGATITVVDSFY